MFKRTIAAAGNLAGYAGYAVPLFIVYFMYNIVFVSEPGPLSPTLRVILGWVYMLLISPFIAAGLFGAVNEQQRTHGETGVGEFLASAWRYYWRVAGANFFCVLFVYVGAIIIAVAFAIEQSEAVGDYVNAAVSVISLFWFASVVVEGGLFASLGRALKILLRNPLALALSILWGLIRFADSALVMPRIQSSLPLSGAEAALDAVMRVLVAVYAVALYRQIRAEALEAQQAAASQPVDVQAGVQIAPSNGLSNASLGFGIVSFVPLAHLVALVLGILAIKRNKSSSVKPVIAVCLGGFFTAVYTLLVAGSLIGGSGVSQGPGYEFLGQANPALQPQAVLLDQGSYEDAQAQLESIKATNSTPHWTVHTALALAKWGNNDLDGALESFSAAAQQKPDRSEFYYLYGRAALANGDSEWAAQQFQNAASYAPRLVLAERYASLLQAAYTPPQLVSAAFSIIILLILFTVHEYGHAFAAWKLGDDTAKNAGRLTLSPIAHLDLFGSILLPGILLFRGSDFVFGWAKPVPVNPANFKNPRKDHMLVSFAGPAVNLLVAMVCFLLLGCIALALRLLWPQTMTWHFASPWGSTALIGAPFSHGLAIAVIFIKQLMYMSLILGFFNLLPIPPLDGSWILSGLLPEGLGKVFERVRPFAYVIFLVMIFTSVVDYYLAVPILGAYGGLSFLISTLGLG